MKIPLSNNELIKGLLIVFLMAFIVAESRWMRLQDPNAVSSPKPVHIYLEERTDLNQLSDMLADSGLIQSREELQWAAKIYGWRFFREGHYFVDRGFTYDRFLSKMAKGIQDPVSITILPGRSMSSIVGSVAKDMQFDSLSFHRTVTDSLLLDSLNLKPRDVIGRLYPNTYSVYWTMSPKAVLKRILKEFNKVVVRGHKQELKKHDYTLNEIITLASIVEWEAHDKSEKATISGLYWNRLKRGMRLQADPTINFTVGDRRRLLYEDYRVEHPYNTYLHKGLPPGPITNPSLSSIKAALNPADHQYLYMVATPDGGHAFSKTFEEHKRKSQKWRSWLQKQYRIKRQREQNSK